MIDIPALVARLTQSGASIEVIQIVVNALEPEQKRREANRQRTARWRHRDVTVTSQPKTPAKSNGALRHRDVTDHNSSFLLTSLSSSVATSSVPLRRERASVAGRGLSADLQNDFGLFYQKYPRHVAKRAALKAYAAARSRASAAEILAGCERYAVSADPNYTAHPATWLNADRWLDENKAPKEFNWRECLP